MWSLNSLPPLPRFCDGRGLGEGDMLHSSRGLCKDLHRRPSSPGRIGDARGTLI